MKYKLDLELSPKKFHRAGIDLYLNWENCVDSDGTEPAFVFKRSANWKKTVAIMRLSELHNFVAHSGYGMAAAVAMGMRMAEAIGFMPGDKYAAREVTDMIVDYADDLRKMPSTPPKAPHTQVAGEKAELSIKIDGQTILETEVAV